MRLDVEEVGGLNIERAEQLIGDIPGAIDLAARRALGRASTHLRAEASKRARERYKVSASDVKSNVRTSVSNKNAKGSSTSEVHFVGPRISLYKFGGASPKAPTPLKRLVRVKTKYGWRQVNPGRAATGHQLTTTGPTKFRQVFTARMPNGHTGLFERTGAFTGTGLEKIREIMGDSVPTMIGNDAVADRLKDDMVDAFVERFDHEVDAIANGWSSIK